MTCLASNAAALQQFNHYLVQAKVCDAPITNRLRMAANSYSLYFKTHSYHWNVEGPHFKQLHDIFETQYTELWNAVDDIAERIRALDDYAPSTHASLAKLSSIEEKETPPHWKEMIGDLARGNELLAKNAREVLRIAEDAGDDATADLVTPRITHHEKTAWMLRAQAQA